MSFLDFDDSGSKPSSFLLPSFATADTPASRDARDAADEEELLAEFKKNPKAAMALAESYVNASQAPRQAMTEITPIPGFVIQTQTTKESNMVPIGAKSVVFPKDTVVFINLCHSHQIPQPNVASEAEIKRAINAEEGASYQVPFQVSPPREHRDPEPFKRSEKDFDYKLYIMELAMEWVEEKCRIELSRNFQLPDMKSKDELKKRSVILPKPPAIQEVDRENTTKSSEKPATDSTTVVTRKQEGSILVPVAGKDDIILQSRLMPCPKGTLGIIVEINLPNHRSMDGVTLDVVSPDRLILHSKSQGQDVDGGNEYHVEVDLPNEPVDLDTVRAEFSKSKSSLRIYTIKKKRK
ncbi:PIH1 domain-containing protein 1 [Dissophora globulifera]|uniref:PIH1 domain-containing protein 1 n=1 Tax=Dissophora globulifera TaxID=979702 RepID=A0A9P6RF01_9FUNG|nr:PIH1 domain-containing protein 1 [Dissophora globulifera]